MVNKLQLQKTKVDATVSGVGSHEVSTVKYKVNITISTNPCICTTAYVLKNVTKILPSTRITSATWEHLQNLVLADPTFDIPRKVDMIIGAEVIAEILQEGVIKGKPGSPIAQQTIFGWIISGNTSLSNPEKLSLTCHVTLADLDKQVRKFWESEDLDRASTETQVDKSITCEKLFKQTVTRNKEGRYIVRIPFEVSPERVLDTNNSKKRATARLLHMERVFTRNPKLADDYRNFMTEYIALGHMSKCSTINEQGTYYLPHHAVSKPDSTTTKLRVVFDASAKSSVETSLNQLMYTGPKIQENLTSILIRWRKHKIVFTADIEKMYRQILVDPEDRKYQRILWRDSPNEQISEYELNTVTYGTASAPFLATRTLKQLAIDEGQNYPKAEKILLSDFYVDDVMSGGDTLDDVRECKKQLINLLNSGGFNLRKWNSNVNRLLGKEVQSLNVVEFDREEHVKTLGLHWHPTKDYFTFEVSQYESKINWSKRKVLSEIARIFDPLGWLAPAILRAKLLLQDIWMEEELDWESPLPVQLKTRWEDFRKDLNSIQQMKIHRWTKYSSNATVVEIHGFCDASERAYGAAVYMRIIDKEFNVTTTLLTSRSKVTPKQKKGAQKNNVTIPKLELCGAVLLANLLWNVKRDLDIKSAQIFAWCDSTVALAWINAEPNKWKAFVAHRVQQIQDLNTGYLWRHVKSEDNPADLASRGTSPSSLKELSLWWKGPAWLQSRQSLNAQAAPNMDLATDLELKISAHHITKEEPQKLEDITLRYSSLTRLIRVIALCHRFINNTRESSQTRRKVGPLSTAELNYAHNSAIKVAQRELQEDYHTLQQNKPLPAKSNISNLNPFIHEGILRVGGRLQNSALSTMAKHPVIIPHKSHFAKLIIDWAHKTTLHGGNDLTIGCILTKYWIVKGRGEVSNFIKRCIRCQRFNSKQSSQIMGNLPAPRVTIARPFTHTGVDYAGPFMMKASKMRNSKLTKGYIAVFVCLATKAFHLEAVSDLSTETFLAAFDRLSSRRGLVSHLYSDNGTNFVGACAWLKKQYTNEDPNFTDTMATKGVTWHFIPPAAPHFGGLWEAGVKSVKLHLKKTIGDTHLTFEEFSTLLTKIEACLNSRPLCPMSGTTDDLEALTPAHFLIGSNMFCRETDSMLNIQENRLTRWQFLNKMQQQFWKKWSSEYITRLQQRPKWTQQTNNIAKGYLVLVREDNVTPSNWCIGRIQETHPGRDGHVRVVTVKTSTGCRTRPITKLSKLATDKPVNINPTKTTTNESGNTAHNDQNHQVKCHHIQVKRSNPQHNNKIKIRPTNIPPRPPIEQLIERHQNRKRVIEPNIHPSEIKRKRSIVPSLVATIALALLVWPIPSHAQFVNKPFTMHPGLYFEDTGNINLISSKWRMLTYYNLTNYKSQLIGLHNMVQQIEKGCEALNSSSECDNILSLLSVQVSNIEERNKILYGRGGRVKRSPFDIVGKLSNQLFGILDQDYAHEIENQISKLRQDDEYSRSLLKNQTSIVETTLSIMKTTEQQTMNQFTLLQERVTNITSTLQNAIHKVEQTQLLTALGLTTHMYVNNIEQIQDTLLEVVLNTQQGTTHHLIITPQLLRRHLMDIRQHIPPTMVLPVSERPDQLLQLYKLMTVSGRITASYVVFDCKIPILDAEKYQVFRIIPVPTPHQNKFAFIAPTSEYILTNLAREKYYPMAKHEFEKCIPAEEGLRYCSKCHPIYNLQSNTSQCEINLLNHNKKIEGKCEIIQITPRQVWVPLRNPNSWLYVMDKETTFNLVCKGRSFAITLINDGILTLTEGCQLNIDTMVITAHNQYTTILNDSFTPQINLTTMMPNSAKELSIIQSTDARIFNYPDEQIRRLDQSIRVLKEAENSKPYNNSTNNTHHILHYSSSSIIIIALIIVFIRRYQGTHKQHNIPTPAPRANTSVPSLNR